MNSRLLRYLLLVSAGALALLGSADVAQARCVTVGADGISHTQCDLP